MLHTTNHLLCILRPAGLCNTLSYISQIESAKHITHIPMATPQQANTLHLLLTFHIWKIIAVGYLGQGRCTSIKEYKFCFHKDSHSLLCTTILQKNHYFYVISKSTVAVINTNILAGREVSQFTTRHDCTLTTERDPPEGSVDHLQLYSKLHPTYHSH